MARARSATADPTSSLALLWRGPDGPPSPAGLDAARVIRAAIELADADGLGAVSMRRVADRLGVGTMSLYTHVPGKAELLAAMVDVVVGETARPDVVAGGWRGRVTLVARENLALLRRHPWIVEVDIGRPPIGPNMLAKYDYELGAVEGIGLTDVEMDAVVTLVLAHAAGLWGSATAPLAHGFLDAERFARAVRVAAAVAEADAAAPEPDHGFAFGLDRLLDGIEELLRLRAGG